MTTGRSILAGFAVAALTWAQNGPAFHSKTELVVVSCSVVNAKGAFVDDLTRDEFQVSDNGARRNIAHFAVDADLPLTIGIIVDASESQKDQFDEHRQTAVSLLEKLFRAGDRAFVISVEEDIRLWADLTDRVSDIRSQLAGPPGALFGEPCAKRPSAATRPISDCGSSPLWNAVYAAANLEMSALRGNKILLLLTDGFDSGSSHGWRQAADAVERVGAAVYAIQYRSGFGRSYAPDLYRLIGETGGAWFEPPRGDFQAILSRIDTDFRRRYVLGFRPEPLSRTNRHEVYIDVTRPDVTIRSRTRKIYFDDAR